MVINTEDDTVAQIKDLLEEKTTEIQEDIDKTISTLTPEELTTFENRFYGDYEYYQEKYASEDSTEDAIFRLFGCFPIEYILSEVGDYIRRKAYMGALHEFVHELEDHV